MDNQYNKPEEKRIKQIVNNGSAQKQTSVVCEVLRIFAEVFLSEIKERTEPSLKDIAVDLIVNSVQDFAYHDDPRRKVSSNYRAQSYSNPLKYQQVSSPSPVAAKRTDSVGIVKNPYSDITVKTREDAEEVIDYISEILSYYQSASVKDMYDMVGIPCDYTAQYYGWTDISGAYVQRERDGRWRIHMPRPMPLNY